MRPISWVIIVVAAVSVVASLLGSKVKLIHNPPEEAERSESRPQVRENKTYVRFADHQELNGWYAQIPGPNGEMWLLRLNEKGKPSLDVASEQPSPTPVPTHIEEG